MLGQCQLPSDPYAVCSTVSPGSIAASQLTAVLVLILPSVMGPVEAAPEYRVIVDANNLTVEIENELSECPPWAGHLFDGDFEGKCLFQKDEGEEWATLLGVEGCLPFSLSCLCHSIIFQKFGWVEGRTFVSASALDSWIWLHVILGVRAKKALALAHSFPLPWGLAYNLFCLNSVCRPCSPQHLLFGKQFLLFVPFCVMTWFPPHRGGGVECGTTCADRREREVLFSTLFTVSLPIRGICAAACGAVKEDQLHQCLPCTDNVRVFVLCLICGMRMLQFTWHCSTLHPAMKH